MVYRKHSYYNLLKYMQLLEDGYTFHHVVSEYKVDSTRLSYLWKNYQRIGTAALVHKSPIKVDGVTKETIMREHLEKHVSLTELSDKYNVACSSMRTWRIIVKKQGYDALYRPVRQVLHPAKHPVEDMGRPKKKEPQTELEKLQYENARLRAENDLLKKVKALVEAREARLREIGRKPSKN